MSLAEQLKKLCSRHVYSNDQRTRLDFTLKVGRHIYRNADKQPFIDATGDKFVCVSKYEYGGKAFGAIPMWGLSKDKDCVICVQVLDEHHIEDIIYELEELTQDNMDEWVTIVNDLNI